MPKSKNRKKQTKKLNAFKTKRKNEEAILKKKMYDNFKKSQEEYLASQEEHKVTDEQEIEIDTDEFAIDADDTVSNNSWDDTTPDNSWDVEKEIVEINTEVESPLTGDELDIEDVEIVEINTDEFAIDK